MRSRLLGTLLVLLIGAAVAFWLWRPDWLKLGQKAPFTPVAYGALPGWHGAQLHRALEAFARSCAKIRALSPTAVMGSYAGRAADWQVSCAALRASPLPNARAYFETHFRAYHLADDALFTGYYEPLLQGSRTRHGGYQTPIYALPPDLISVDLGKFRPELAGQRIAGRVESQRLVPYATRAEIDAKPPNAATLLYADDPVAVFFLHIQGSGRVALDSGATIRVAYAGQNGHPYTPVGRVLVADGALNKGELSMQSIRRWLKAHPDAGRKAMEEDASFIFFAENPVGDPALGSVGTEGVPLTPRASIAVDNQLHALGTPFFISAATPDGNMMQELAIAQDTGGAIKGFARADIFFGFGSEAERLAGGMKSNGGFYVLIPKNVSPNRPP